MESLPLDRLSDEFKIQMYQDSIHKMRQASERLNSLREQMQRIEREVSDYELIIQSLEPFVTRINTEDYYDTIKGNYKSTSYQIALLHEEDKDVYNPEWTIKQKVAYVVEHPNFYQKSTIQNISDLVEAVQVEEPGLKNQTESLKTSFGPAVSRMLREGSLYRYRSKDNHKDTHIIPSKWVEESQSASVLAIMKSIEPIPEE